ncbi:MAG: hypothetical protein IPK19_39115 [Chloroflexi bacterium]|nr:hypothetical protein [Chloroflexota bacterium]
MTAEKSSTDGLMLACPAARSFNRSAEPDKRERPGQIAQRGRQHKQEKWDAQTAGDQTDRIVRQVDEPHDQNGLKWILPKHADEALDRRLSLVCTALPRSKTNGRFVGNEGAESVPAIRT